MLFRPEAVERSTRPLPGDVLLAAPLTGRVLAIGSAVVLAVGLAAAATLTFPRTVTVSGQVVPSGGLIEIVAPADATVLDVSVSDGGQVAADDPVVSLQMSGANSALDQSVLVSLEAEGDFRLQEARAEIASLESELERQEVRRRHLNGSRAAAEERQRIQAQLTEISRASALAAAELHQRGYLPTLELQNRQAQALAHEDASVAQSEAVRAIIVELAELDRAAQGTRARAQALHASLNAIEAMYAQRTSEMRGRSRYVVRAPASGVISALPVRQGQSVPGGALLASLVPPMNEMEVELAVPPSAISHIEVGQDVRISYAPYPAHIYGAVSGRVKSVSRSPTMSLAASPGSPPGSTRAFTVRVQILPGEDQERGRAPLHVQSGVSVTASIVVERRTPLQWLLAPINRAMG